jgi:hemin uptake protein HemP
MEVPHSPPSIRPARAGDKTDAMSEAPARRAAIDSRSLFARSNMVVIRHGGADYRLRITGRNKLILTK